MGKFMKNSGTTVSTKQSGGCSFVVAVFSNLDFTQKLRMDFTEISLV